MISIIGSGPAGVSAALYLARANKEVVVFTNHKSSLLKAKRIENYYGLASISGEELYEAGINQLKSFNIKIVEEEILNITTSDNFIIETSNNKYKADNIVLATGSIKQNAKIKNLNKFEGNGVSYCATCDGFFFKNKKVAVIGNSTFALHELEYLKNITTDLYLLTNGLEIPKTDYQTYTDKIKEIIGTNRVEKIIFDNNHELEIDGIFIADDYPDTNVLTKKCGILTDKNGIVVTDKFETNIPGIYACGDAIKGHKQIAKAVYEGMMVANSIIQK